MNNTYVQAPGRPAGADLGRVTEHLLPALYSARPEPLETVQLQDTLKRWHMRFLYHNLSGLVGHGNVISTTLDLLRFDQALYAGKLLAPATLALATAPARLADGSLVSAGTSVDYGGAISYGLGWVLHEDPLTGKVVGHDGYNGGIATMLYRNVTNKQTVILFDNTVGEQFREKVAAVLGILQNQQPVALTIKESVARGYGAALLKDGPESALLLLNALRTDTLRYQLSEREMNVLGYELLFNGYAAHSLEAFKINTLLFPASFNVYDSYGDAFRAAGRHKEAILMYQKALALNPNSEGSKQALRLLQATPE
jgi:tetratricopeptide (TPR) repeat protein